MAVYNASGGGIGFKPVVRPDALADCCTMISIDEPAILEDVDLLLSGPEEVVGVASALTGTKPPLVPIRTC